MNFRFENSQQSMKNIIEDFEFIRLFYPPPPSITSFRQRIYFPSSFQIQISSFFKKHNSMIFLSWKFQFLVNVIE